MADYSSLLNLGQKAVSAGDAGRLAMAGNAEYLTFRNEVLGISAPTATEQPDWALIERMAVDLAAQTPDLLVFSHVCLAVVNTRGYGALAAGLTAFRDLVRDGWSLCAKGKAWQEVFKTFSRRMALGIRARPPERERLDELKAAEAAASELSAIIAGNGGPALAELVDTLQGFVNTFAPPPAPPPPPPAASLDLAPSLDLVTPEPAASSPASAATSASPTAQTPVAAPAQAPVAAPAQAPVAAPTAQSAQAAPPMAAPTPGTASAPEPSGSVSDEDGRSRSVLERDIAQGLVKLAALLREDNPQDTAPYRMLRVMMWATAKLPVADKQQRTRLQPPAPHVLKRLQAPIADGKAKDALRETEELFRTYPLWLDLQLRTVRALEALQATAPIDAISREVALLLERVPELLELKFATGVPLASDETVAWCREAIARSASGPARAAMHPVPVASQAAPMQAAAPTPASAPIQVQIAYTPPPLSNDGEGPAEALPPGLGPGLAALNDRLMRAPSARRRFEIRLDMVGLCLSTGRLDLAKPLLQSIEQELEFHHLEQWEPRLAARARVMQLLAMRASGSLEESRQLRAQLWARLCLLNPAEAVAIGPEP